MNPNQNNPQNSLDNTPSGGLPQSGGELPPNLSAGAGTGSNYQLPSFLSPEQQSKPILPPASSVQPETIQNTNLSQDPGGTVPSPISNNPRQPGIGLDPLPSVKPSPPKSKTFLNKKIIILVSVVVAVLLIGSIVAMLLLKKDKKPAEQSKSSNNNTTTNYSDMKPVDMFNSLIAEFSKDSGVLAGPLHKGTDNGGSAFKNTTVLYDPANDFFLQAASGYGGVEFSVTDNSASEPCKQRLDKVSKYRDKLVGALSQAGYKAVKTRFDDIKDSKGKAICIENTAYYNESSKIYCSEGRPANDKSLTFDIACAKQDHADGRIALSKELVPLLKTAKANPDPYIMIGAPQKSATAGYETLTIFHKPMTDGIFNDIGAYRKNGQPWKLLPDNSGSIQGFDCSILAKDPDIAKAYADKECYTGRTTQTRKI